MIASNIGSDPLGSLLQNWDQLSIDLTTPHEVQQRQRVLTAIALLTGARQVFPGITAATRFGFDVVDNATRPTAVSARITTKRTEILTLRPLNGVRPVWLSSGLPWLNAFPAAPNVTSAA